MRGFWDSRAEEDPFFFVDDRLEYRRPDVERFWALGEEDLSTLLRLAGAKLEPSDRVVEIGCGIGRLTRGIARRAAAVTALDVSPRMLEAARRHNPELRNVEWRLGDGQSLDGIASESADAVISHVVFQHIPDPSITLGYVREIGRVLRPGGWAAFQVSNDPVVHRAPGLPARARRRLRALMRREPASTHDARYRGSHVEIPELREAAAGGSLRLERIVGERTQFCVVLARRVEAGAPERD
jgi:SAM-dependent methyltransferase